MFFALASFAVVTAAPLVPSGKWIVDYRPDMCVVSRQFGAGPQAATLAIKPTVDMSSSSATMLILVPNTGGKDRREGSATVALEPSKDTTKVDFVSWVLKDQDTRAYSFVVGSEFGAKMSAGSELDLTMGSVSFQLRTGSLQSPMSALKACNTDLFQSWGVDVSAVAEPISTTSWFGPDAYPVDAVRNGQQGAVVAIVTVTPDGKPAACKVVISSKVESLDKATCKEAMTRARFAPAPGSTMRSMVLSTRWVLPDR